jgi:hypothetical protein
MILDFLRGGHAHTAFHPLEPHIALHRYYADNWRLIIDAYADLYRDDVSLASPRQIFE